MNEGDLLARLVRFAAALARAVPRSDGATRSTALTLVDLRDRQEVRRGLLTALKVRRQDRQTFDELFDSMWSAEALEDRRDRAASTPAPSAGRFHGPTNPGATPRMGAGRSGEEGVGEGDTPSSTPEAVRRRKPFDECTAQDLAAMERLLARLALRLASAARARRVIWLNPLLGDAGYRPEARGMQAALPFIDRFVPAHTLESLERLLPLLTA